MKIAHSLALVAAACMAVSAHAGTANVLNFDDLNTSNWASVPVDYGDHGLNGNGNAHVGVAYSGNSGGTNYLSFWDSGYADLSNVGFTPSDGTTAGITLTADAGWLITAVSFDLAGWLGDYVTTINYVLGSDATTLTNYLVSGSVHDHFSVVGAGSQTASIRWGQNYNVGIDNIAFTVVAANAVPEPESIALVLMGLAVVGGARRRRT